MLRFGTINRTNFVVRIFFRSCSIKELKTKEILYKHGTRKQQKTGIKLVCVWLHSQSWRGTNFRPGQVNEMGSPIMDGPAGCWSVPEGYNGWARKWETQLTPQPGQGPALYRAQQWGRAILLYTTVAIGPIPPNMCRLEVRISHRTQLITHIIVHSSIARKLFNANTFLMDLVIEPAQTQQLAQIRKFLSYKSVETNYPFNKHFDCV